MKSKGREKENMINSETKESSNTIFYKGMMKHLELDNLVKTFKDIFKSRDFQSDLKYNRRFFTAPIEHLSSSKCCHRDGSPLQKGCFKLKEEFKLSFIIYKIMMDVLDEEELVSILSYFIKDFEGVFVTSTYTERDSVFVKEINLRDISLPPILTNNSNDIDEHIIVSGEDVKEIFKRFKRLNLKEEDFSFYLNSYSRNSFANKIAIGNVDNEFEDKIFTHLKQLQKLVQTYSSTKNLNQMYIGDDSSVKTVTIENVKFFRKLFSEISVDKYLVESDELVNILQEFYFIPKDKIKVEEERQSYLYSILRSKRVELKEFVSDLLNHSSKTN